MNALAPILAATAPCVIATRSVLARALDMAVLVTERRNTYPILANVRLRGDGGTLFMSATNLDIVLDVAMPAAADTLFDVTIPAHTLRDLLKGAPKAATAVSIVSPPVTVKQVPTGEYTTDPANGQRMLDADGAPIPITRDVPTFDGPIELDFQSVKYRLNGLPPADHWPQMKGPVKEWRGEGNLLFKPKAYRAFTIPGAELFAALDAVRFAISTEETRYYLNGICLHVVTPHDKNRPELRFVATDGHRMARQEVTAPEGSFDMPQVIVATGTVDLLLKLLKPAKGKDSPAVTIELNDKTIRFQFDDVTITAKLIEGTFPDYERVIPKQNDKFATFPVAPMLECIKAVSLVASERGGKAVKLTLESGTCKLSVTNPDHGNAEASFPITQEFDGTFEIGFNSRYLADLVTEAKAGGDTVTLAFNDPGSPTVVTGGRDGWLGVLMPMRV